MPNTGESPKDAVESSLSSILEDNVPPKYHLSVKACLGILRRGEKRGKPFPELLKAVLERQAGVSPSPLKSEEDVPGGGKGVLIQTDQSATLATHQDQVLFQPRPAFGFKAGQSARTRSIGWEKETSPSLGAQMSGTEPTVCAYAVDSHPQDSRVSMSKDGTVQTLPARMGTGGGNVPFVLQTVPPKTVRGLRDGRNGKFSPESSESRCDRCSPIPEEGGPAHGF